MNISGIRIHIAGSARRGGNRELLATAHDFVGALASQLIEGGAGLVVGFGDEPLGEHGLPCTFDWPILELIAGSPIQGTLWSAGHPGRFRAIGSQRALDRIPVTKQDIWENCLTRTDFELELTPPGWRMGGVIRALQASRGDVLVVIGGGGGVEELAHLYLSEGKTVIPVRSDLGAISNDGNGGSSYLHGHALREPSSFFVLRDGTSSAAARLATLNVVPDSEPSVVAQATVSLIGDLRPPLAFYIRLLATDSEEFAPVEMFFREVVDPVVVTKGFTPYAVGHGRPNSAFMNVEIFERLHRAALVIADLTGVRPNCTMELGYALARHRRMVITAMKGTRLPFDTDKLPTYFWSPEQTNKDGQLDFRSWLERYIDMPPLVR